MLLRAFVEERHEDILRLAGERLRKLHPQSDVQMRVEQLAPFLDAIVCSLGGAPCPNPQAVAHGRECLGQKLDPTSMLVDYGAVCSALFELTHEGHVPIEPHEVMQVHRCLEDSSTEALRAYWQKERQSLRDQASRALGRLAHDLRNSLSSARLAFHLIQLGRAPRSGGRLLMEALSRMDRLVENALQGSQAALGALRREPMVLGAMLQELVAKTTCERNVKVDLQADPHLEIVGNRRLLTTAFSKLLHNAVSATRDAGKVWVRAKGAARCMARIEVRNECGGKKAPAVDEAAREAVTAHGGHIDVTRLPGVGYLLLVELPDATA